MKFLRLPAHIDEEPIWWQWGSSQKITVLLPGDALLSETLRLPEGITRVGQARQWLLASPDACHWRPESEMLLRLSCEGEHCYYWAVERELWQWWRKLVKQLAPGARWLPDWMLLPLPDNARPFVLKADDIILFRHESGSGGSIPSTLNTLLDPLEPRWLAASGVEEGYPVSSYFWRRQVKRYSRRWPLSLAQPSWRSLLPSLLAVGAAFFVWQAANALWLVHTRQPVAALAVKPVQAPPAEGMSLSSSLAWLEQLQQGGPVQLQRLQWAPNTVNIHAVSLVRCQTLKDRLMALSPAPAYRQAGDLCEIHLDKEDA